MKVKCCICKNRIKNKNDKIISIDIEKAFNKYNTLHIKKTQKTRNRRKLPQPHNG